MLLFLLDAREAVGDFFDAGGPILMLIALLTFIMWLLILERSLYLRRFFDADLRRAVQAFETRQDRYSWFGDSVRRMHVSEMNIHVSQNLGLIKVLIALCPLFGLLGTVTGMIEVFTVLSITGGGDAKSMAGGVSRATIPTMAGMVAALSGVFGNTFLERLAARRKARISSALPQHHLEPAAQES
ncbi:MAG: MotA/TolQ/ExbB proton channel family protein [Oceanococcaceae bacterium]